MATAKRKAPARKTTAAKTTAKKTAPEKAEVQTTTGTQVPVRVEAGGIDPRLVEARERQKAEEAGVALASPQPATIDPKLVEIRDKTIQRERELAGRSLLKPPAKG